MVPSTFFLFNDIDIYFFQKNSKPVVLETDSQSGFIWLFSHDWINIKHFSKTQVMLGPYSVCPSEGPCRSPCPIIGHVDHFLKMVSASFLHHDVTSLIGN